MDINAFDEKQITPLGYAVACGHLGCVKLLQKRGGNLLAVDGQGNTLLHYAAGYGQLPVLRELLESDEFKDGDWKETRNKREQTVVDAARANRKGPVLDFFKEEYGLEPAVPLPPPAEPVEAEVVSESKGKPAAASAESSGNAAARAALLAAAGGAAGTPAAAAPAVDASKSDMPAAAQAAASVLPGVGEGANAQKTANAMRDAVEQLKSNPEAVEQARKMMGKMPPGMLSMLTGNKMSSDQVQKAMDAMGKMSTEEMLDKATKAADQLGSVTAAGKDGAPAAAPAAAAADGAAEGDKAPATRSPARVVD